MSSRFVFVFVVFDCRNRNPSTGMSPSTGIFVSAWVDRVAHQAADDDRLLIVDDERGARGALVDRDRAERARGARRRR